MGMPGVNKSIAMAMSDGRTILWMSASKGGIPLKYREHALLVARRHISALMSQGLTQTEIGHRWGLSQPTISELLSGKASKLGVRVLFCIRDAIKMPLDDLLGLPPLDRDARPSSRRLPQ